MCDINTDLVKFAFFKTIKKVINKDSDEELKKFKLLFLGIRLFST